MNENFKIVGLVQSENEVLEISGIVKLAKLGLHIQGLNKEV